MRKKNNSKTVKQAVKPVEVKKEETVAQPVSEPKADAKADVKAEVEKAVEKTTEKVEKAVEKTTEKVAEKAAEVKADVKDTVKKTTAKAAKAAKTAKEAKPAKKEPVKPEIIVQYQNSEVDTAAVEERVKAQFVAEGHKAGFIKRVMGIEPTYPAWKAGVLPLNYTRIGIFNLLYNAQFRNRTRDTRIFSPLLYQLS